MATNQYLPFAPLATNSLTPTAWSALSGTLLANGFSSGVAVSAQVNTFCRQVSVPVAAISQFIADTGNNALDDGSATNYMNALKSALRYWSMGAQTGSWVPDSSGALRYFFDTSTGYTAVRGNGAQPVRFVNGTGATIASFETGGVLNLGGNAVSNLQAVTLQQMNARTPDATGTVKGLVRLATYSESTNSEVNTSAITPATMSYATLGGSGQTWINMSASRNTGPGTTYTNTTSRAIVTVFGLYINTGNTAVGLYVDGLLVDYKASTGWPVNSHITLTGLVPRNKNYYYSVIAGGTDFEFCNELR